MVSIKTKDIEKLNNILDCKWIRQKKIEKNNFIITVEDGSKNLPKILELALKNKISIESINLKKPALEDVFIHYTGRSIRDEHASEHYNKEMPKMMR